MGKSIRTTSNTQTTTNSIPAHQAHDGLSIVTPSIQRKFIDTLAMTGYGKEGSQ